MKLTKSQLKEMIKEELLKEYGINPAKIEKIEYATYDIEDGFEKLISGLANINSAQMKEAGLSPKVNSELQKQQKAFKKLQKLINNKLVG